MTLDILICSLNKGVVRVQDVLLPPQEGVHYIVSYQYTDERYLDLIPRVLGSRSDVSIYTYKSKGLSANRNLALDKATSDIVMYADDDAHRAHQIADRHGRDVGPADHHKSERHRYDGKNNRQGFIGFQRLFFHGKHPF